MLPTSGTEEYRDSMKFDTYFFSNKRVVLIIECSTSALTIWQVIAKSMIWPDKLDTERDGRI